MTVAELKQLLDLYPDTMQVYTDVDSSWGDREILAVTQREYQNTGPQIVVVGRG